VHAIVGHEAELEAVERFLDGVPSGPLALVVEGEAGIGAFDLATLGEALAIFERLGASAWASRTKSRPSGSKHERGTSPGFAAAGFGPHSATAGIALNVRRACQMPQKTSAMRMGVPVTNEIRTKLPTPLTRSRPRRSPDLARQ
jgi:hypothetical protein